VLLRSATTCILFQVYFARKVRPCEKEVRVFCDLHEGFMQRKPNDSGTRQRHLFSAASGAQSDSGFELYGFLA